MRPFVGLDFDGGAWAGPGALSIGRVSLGQPVWGPIQLLRDLELRLGLVGKSEPEVLRVARWQARMAAVTERGRYYSRSFDVDPLGTAEAVLRLRDALVEAGWEGQPLMDGGSRLNAVQELEQLGHPALQLGMADRLAAMDRTLAVASRPLYDEVSLAESSELWPARWQSIFRSLERAGTRFSRFAVRLPGAAPGSDLAAIQAVLSGTQQPSEAPAIRGDGSLIHVTAETGWEAACATAAIVAPLSPEDTVVIRGGEHAALDGAFLAHGLRTQGLTSATPWRSAVQVLPLALELSFEPKDPYHVLELLTLPVGPFQGWVGHELARALAEAPGIGGRPWESAKAKLRADDSRPDRTRTLSVLQEWLETRGADPTEGAPKPVLLAVVARVRTWILSRIASAPDDIPLLSAAQHCSALSAALSSDPRQTLTLAEVRKLRASVLSASGSVEVAPEQAGRVEHVTSAAAMQAPRRVVVWWSFNDHAAPSPRPPWRKPELLALSRAGLVLPDPQRRLVERAAAARRALACATERVVLVSASSVAGTSLGTHPLWDEIVARAGLDERALSRLTVSSTRLRDGTLEPRAPHSPALTNRPGVELPGGRTEWSPGCAISPIDHLSFQSLDALLRCPLRWVLRYRAGTHSGGHALSPLFQLNGKLGHRLVEELHQRGSFDGEDTELASQATAILVELYEREAALLLRPGMAFERGQLERQLVTSVVELSRALRAACLRIVAVEVPLEATHGAAQVVGRIDLVVEHVGGEQAIIDTKWGIAAYRDQLRSGHALQLALYAYAHATKRAEATLPSAAYFSLKQGKLFSLSSPIFEGAEILSGPRLDDTWNRAARSLSRASTAIAAGRFAVSGLRHSLPLLSALGVSEEEQPSHFQYAVETTCKYCEFDGLCGRRWEELA